METQSGGESSSGKDATTGVDLSEERYVYIYRSRSSFDCIVERIIQG